MDGNRHLFRRGAHRLIYAMNLTTLTTPVRRFLRQVTYGDRIRPQRDWLLIIGVGGIIFLVSVTWNYWLFHKVSAGESLQAGTAAAPVIDTATLESVRAIFDRRAAERAHYENDYRFVDPSH
jgi:hypothetical protein